MTTLIKNIDIIDGESDVISHGDVFLSGDKISAIGNFPHKKADQMIDGTGMVLTPGFIDIHSNADHYYNIFHPDNLKNLVSQGITTLICGQDGVSIAPINSRNAGLVRDWSGSHRNINWQSFKELLISIYKTKPILNIGSLVGFWTIFSYIGAKNISGKDFKQVFDKVLKDSFSQGALGISISDDIAKETPLTAKDLKKIIDLCGKGTVISFSSENEGENMEPVLKAIKANRQKLILGNFKPTVLRPKKHEVLAEEAEKNGAYFQINTTEENIFPIFKLFPEWFVKKGIDGMRAGLKDRWFLTRIAKELPSLDPDKIWILRSSRFLHRRTLRSIMTDLDLETPEQTILYVASNDINTVLSIENSDHRILERLVRSDHSLVGSQSLGLHSEFPLESELDRSVFPNYLEFTSSCSIDRPVAIKKITSVPANLLGIEGRGAIKEGYFADLVFFKNNEIENVIVNGKIAVKAKEFIPANSGRIVYKKDPNN